VPLGFSRADEVGAPRAAGHTADASRYGAARFLSTAMSTPPAVGKGLEHVVLGRSEISLVAGETGGLVYRGFDIRELVRNAGYEAVVHLLLNGEPPSEPTPAWLHEELSRRRVPPEAALRIADTLPTTVPPMDALRTLLSSLGDGSYPYPPTVEQGLDLIARTPTLLARFYRRSHGLPPVPPRADLGHAANYLYMLLGEEPSATHVQALEDYLILLADHGMNASTFALRVVLSTDSDLFSAVTAALAALKGPAHGGAPARVSEMLNAVGTPDRAAAWIAARLDAKQRLYGFGHRAYKTDDPRGLILHEIARSIATPARFELAEAVEREALRALRERRPTQRLFTNVEFYSAVVLESVGLGPEMFTPTFAIARTAGWTAHALEQARDNRLIRPDVEYVGPPVGRAWPAAARRPRLPGETV